MNNFTLCNQRTNIWDYITNQILKIQELITLADGVFSHECCHPQNKLLITQPICYNVSINYLFCCEQHSSKKYFYLLMLNKSERGKYVFRFEKHNKSSS